MPVPIPHALPLTEDAQAFGAAKPKRDVWRAVRRGFRGLCPACGEGKMFRAYLKVSDTCPSCGEELHHHRADDAPPYFTLLITGHVVGSLLLLADTLWPDAPLWLHMALWPTLALVMSLWLLPIVKGGLIANQWALRMHGFDRAARGEPYAAAATVRDPRR